MDHLQIIIIVSRYSRDRKSSIANLDHSDWVRTHFCEDRINLY